MWLSFFVSLGSEVLMLLGTEEGRFFLKIQRKKNENKISLTPLYGKLLKIESSSLRQWKSETFY